MAPIRVGFIGLSAKGWASTSLVSPLFDPLLSSSYSLTALCTTSEASAAAAAEKYSKLAGHAVKTYHGDDGPRAIANDPEVDLVAVSVRMPAHYKAVMPAIEAGKDIFIEWVPGASYEETVKIAEAARKKGVRVLVGAQGIQQESMKKVKEIIDSGKIGKIISTSAILSSPGSPDSTLWTDKAPASSVYAYDIKNGTTLLSVVVGHFLSVFAHILGDVASISASGAIQFPTAAVIDADGNPTGETVQKTVHDQVALSGVLQSADDARTPGAFFNLHCRTALPLSGPYGQGRTALKWIIDGKHGTLEVQSRPEDGAWGAFLNLTEKRVLLNGEEVRWETTEADRLGPSGKAWLEFAKGEDGVYYDLEKSVKVHRVLDAALTSIQDGKRISLIQLPQEYY